MGSLDASCAPRVVETQTTSPVGLACPARQTGILTSLTGPQSLGPEISRFGWAGIPMRSMETTGRRPRNYRINNFSPFLLLPFEFSSSYMRPVQAARVACRYGSRIPAHIPVVHGLLPACQGQRCQFARPSPGSRDLRGSKGGGGPTTTPSGPYRHGAHRGAIVVLVGFLGLWPVDRFWLGLEFQKGEVLVFANRDGSCFRPGSVHAHRVFSRGRLLLRRDWGRNACQMERFTACLLGFPPGHGSLPRLALPCPGCSTAGVQCTTCHAHAMPHGIGILESRRQEPKPVWHRGLGQSSGLGPLRPIGQPTGPCSRSSYVRPGEVADAHRVSQPEHRRASRPPWPLAAIGLA